MHAIMADKGKATKISKIMVCGPVLAGGRLDLIEGCTVRINLELPVSLSSFYSYSALHIRTRKNNSQLFSSP